MNEPHGNQTNYSPQYNKNPHFEFHGPIHGDIIIQEGRSFNEMCIQAVVLALVAVILVLAKKIITA
jgi:hypothetical protein